MTQHTIDNFEQIILNKTPLIDVRAPIEFENGAFVNAVNLPLMDNKERELVGIRYKNNGNKAAVELGNKLVSGNIKEQRINKWIAFIKQNPNAILYCFRGGQRSGISQEWLSQRGYDIPRIKGGYKAFRAYILQELENPKNFTPIRLGGSTGSGKTIVINKLKNSIDLEGLANHRGSAFGNFASNQPTQINFENNLLYNIKHKVNNGFSKLVFEDECQNIGKVTIPYKFYNFLSNAPLVVLESSLHKRVENIFLEYIVNAQKEYNNFDFWVENMLTSFKRIEKRLGNKRYNEAIELFKSANKTDINNHKLWIELLLKEYYDPMYNYQLKQSKNQNKIILKATKEEVLQYLQTTL